MYPIISDGYNLDPKELRQRLPSMTDSEIEALMDAYDEAANKIFDARENLKEAGF